MDRPRPEEYQPPLTLRAHLSRLLPMLAVSAVIWVDIYEQQAEERPLLFWADLVVGLCCYVAVLGRRRRPVTVMVAVACVGALSGIAAGPALLAAVSVATRRVWWEVGLALAVNLAAAELFNAVYPSEDPRWLLSGLNVLFIAGVLGWGMYLGSRRELVWTLRQRAERAEAERELRAEQARGTERARIAREMHDVLAHRMSQISLHAGAMSFREDLTAEQMRGSAGMIRELAHEALTDLRGVLGVLRDEGGAPAVAPQPTYADVAHLVTEAERLGMRIALEDVVDDAEEPVPDAVGRTVYRIVQEGITNVRKHAPGALLSIRLHGSPADGVDVRLTNPVGFGTTDTPGSGLGLVGLGERAALRGGRLEHGRDGAVFVLHGWIPWAA